MLKGGLSYGGNLPIEVPKKSEPKPKPAPVKVEPPPQVSPTTILPTGYKIGSDRLERDFIAPRLAEWGFASVPSIYPQQREVINLKRGYWEQPHIIARYHNFIKAAPPGWKAPEWLDVKSVEAAYKYMEERNQTADWTKWKYLPEEDDATNYLRNQMQMPPAEFLFPEEAEAQRNQLKIGTWDDLYPYQQLKETIGSPQPETQVDPSGRPISSIQTANVVNSLFQGVGGFGIGAFAAKAVMVAGTALGGSVSIPILAAGLIGAAVFAATNYHTLKTGERVPVLSDMIEKIGITNVLSKGAEILIGTVGQIADAVMDDDIYTIIDELPEALKVSEARYEVTPATSPLNFTNIWQNAAELLGAEGATAATRAQEGEVYRWDLGLPDPQKLPEGYEFGVNALNDMRAKLHAGGDAETIIQDYKNQFGTQGVVQDFVGQMVLDPMNYAPAIAGGIMRNIGKYKNNQAMMDAWPVPTTKNLIVEGLPTPLNMIVPLIGGEEWQGSVGLMDGLSRLQNFYATGYFARVEDFVPPKEYAPGMKVLAELDGDGNPKYITPDVQEPGIQGLFKKMVNLTPDSKAQMTYANVLDHIGVLATMSNDPDMVGKILKTAGMVDVDTTAQAFLDIVKPEGLDGSALDVRNFVKPIAGATADFMHKIDADGLVDNYYQSNWVVPAQSRAVIENMSKLLDMSSTEFLDKLGRGIDLSADLKVKAAENNIKGFDTITNDQIIEVAKVFGGKDALPLTSQEYNAMLVNKFGDKLLEYTRARFGLGKDTKFNQFASLLKNIQSLLVLDYNPAYYINNVINNVIWSSSNGAYGLTNRARMASYMDRLGVSPTRMDTGFAADSKTRLDFGIGSDGKVTKVADVVRAENDLLGAANKLVKDVRQNFGIFNRLSSVAELGSSRQIYYKAIKTMQSQLWQRNNAIRPLPQSADRLPEEVRNRLYDLMESSLNADEVDANFYKGKSAPTISEMSHRILENFIGGYEDAIVNADVIRDMVDSVGLFDELDSLLPNVKNNADIDNVFADVEGRIQDMVQKAMSADLDTRLEDVKNRVDAEGITALTSELSDAELWVQRIWIRKDEDFIDLFSRNGSMDKGEFGQQYYLLRRRHDAQFASANEWRKGVLSAIFESIGQNKEHPSVKGILDAYQNTYDGWNEAFQFRDGAYFPLFEETFADQKSYDIAKAEIDALVQKKFDAAQAIEANNLNKINEAYIQLAKNPEVARQWRAQVTEANAEMRRLTNGYLKGLKDTPPVDGIEKNYRWQEFFRKIHEPYIVVLQSLAGQMQGVDGSPQSIKTDSPDLIADAFRMRDILNSDPGEVVSAFPDANYRERVANYLANDILPRETIREMYIASGRYDEAQTDIVMNALQARADDWGRNTGNNPREWWAKYIREIRYADRPEDVLHELFTYGTTQSNRRFAGLQGVIESMPNRIPADELMNWLKGKADRAEITDIDFDKWIKQQTGMIEKSAALDYLNSQAVRIDRADRYTETMRLSALEQESLNYRSVQEFIKDYGLYHGTSGDIVGDKLKFGVGDIRKGGHSGGLFLTDDPEIAGIFGDRILQAPINIKDLVIDLTKPSGIDQIRKVIGDTYKTIDGETAIFTNADFDLMFPGGKADYATISQYPEIIEMVIGLSGKRGIAFDEYAGGKTGKTYQILDGEIPVYSINQLTDAYNNAHRVEGIAELIISRPNQTEGAGQVGRVIFSDVEQDGKRLLAVMQIETEESAHSIYKLVEYAAENDYQGVLVPAAEKLTNSVINNIKKKLKVDITSQDVEAGTLYRIDITDEVKNTVGPRKVVNTTQEILDLAWKYGIATATKEGKPTNRHALNVINKYSGSEYKSLDKVPVDVAIIAFERRLAEVGGEKVTNPLIEKVDPGLTPKPQPNGRPLNEMAYDYLYPLLDSAKAEYKSGYRNYQPLTIDNIPENIRPDIAKWINQSKADMSSMKYTSMKYAEARRDQMLHNYSNRTGFDELLSTPFPYIYWYTRSMMNWAATMLDKPGLYATYARYKEMQKELERQGIPNRFKNKMRFYAPYLPDWMGGGLWQDPIRQLFPFSTSTDPMRNQAWLEDSIRYEAYKVLNEQEDEGKITMEEAQVARESREGAVWQAAFAEAQERTGTMDPVSLASIVASPAMYLTIPYYLATGKQDKIAPTPLLRTTQAVETLSKDTIFGGIGKMIGGIGGMEVGLRRKAMTPAVAMFGEYGDYYVDRQLSNMVADGVLSIDEARLAMVERDGPDYDAAVNRVREEVALKVPGSAAVMAAKNGANIPQFAAAVFHSLMPSGILPTGELQYLEKKDDYSYAWDMYNKGYKEQLNQFFEDNPEFEARVTIKDDPDERLQNFLVSEIWDRYMSLDNANKQLVRDQLGRDFQEAFMQRAYDAIPVDKLAMWANAIGGVIPQVEGMEGIGEMPGMEMWDPQSSRAYQEYTDTRDQMFPNWYAVEQGYFDKPKGQRQAYLSSHPELKEYWDWKDTFRQLHPEIESIMAYKSAQHEQENAMMNMQMLESMPEELTMQLQSYALMGTNMGPGAWEALRFVWKKSGQPYGNLKVWVDEVIVESVR